MNTLLKRKLSSVIPSESIAKNIGKVKSKSFCNTISRHKNIDKKIKDKKQKNKKHHNEDCNEHVIKRQKKTHYNEQMEPIRISGTGFGSIKLGGDIGCLPKRIREVVWNTYNGDIYSSKCYVSWCNNIINVFNYQVGHDIPESKGGTYDIDNLKPICSNCNLSMGNKWTIQEWGKLINPEKQDNKLSDKEQSDKEQSDKEQTDKEQNNKTDLQVNTAITPETTSRITFITLLLLTLNFMIF